MVSALVSRSSGPASSPAGHIVLCSWATHFTLTAPLSTQGPVPERRNNSIPGINVPYFRDNFIPGINSVPERWNNTIKGIKLG